MTRAAQRQVLEAFSRDYIRELHHFTATDLGARPTFVFQQLYNRLQRHAGAGETGEGTLGEGGAGGAGSGTADAADAAGEGAAADPLAALLEPVFARRSAAAAPFWLHAVTWPRESEALIRTFAGHTGEVTACAFSPDGQTVVSASRDRTLRLWYVRSGACLAALAGHAGEVTACAFSPDGQTVVSASRDTTLRLWDVRSSACCATLDGHTREVTACAFSPDGETILSGSDDGTLRLWDGETGAYRTTLADGSPVRGCAFSLDGGTIVSTSGSRLSLWDARTGARHASLRRRDLDLHSAVLSCAFSPGGETIVSTRFISFPELWDTRTGARRATLKGHIGAGACAFSPDGETLVTAGGSPYRSVLASDDGMTDHNTLRLWDARTGACRASVEGHADRVCACAFSPDGQTIVSGSRDNTVKLWEARTAARRTTPEDPTDDPSGPDSDLLRVEVTACAFSPDGETIVSGAGPEYTLKLWDARTGACRALEGRDHKRRRRYFGWVTACAFSPDGQTIVFASGRGLRQRDARTAARRATLTGHRFWPFGGDVYACALSPDGQTIVVASYQTLRLWDAHNGARRATLKGHTDSVCACAFSPDGQTIVSAGRDLTLKLWDARSGACRATLVGHTDRVTACAFSPDGETIVSGSDDKTLKLWEARSGACRATLEGHTREVVGCAFSPDGESIVSAGKNETLRLWDARAGAERYAFPAETAVRGCELSPLGDRVCLGDRGGTVYILELCGALTAAPAPQPEDPARLPHAAPQRVAASGATNRVRPTRPAPLRTRRAAFLYLFLAITFAAAGYLLTTVSAWPWLVAVPLFWMSLGSLIRALTALIVHDVTCPYCSQQTPVMRRPGTKTCGSCKREFTLPAA